MTGSVTPPDRQGAGAPDVVLVGELAATMHRLGHGGGKCPVPARPRTCGAYRLAIKYAPEALAAAGRVLAERLDKVADEFDAALSSSFRRRAAGLRLASDEVARWCGVPEGAGGGEGG